MLIVAFLFASCSTAKPFFANFIDSVSAKIQKLSDNIEEKERERLVQNLDLTDPTIRHIHEILKTIDYDHAHYIFLKSPDNFMIWIWDKENIDMVMLASACHEANHMLNSDLSINLRNDYKSRYFFLGDIYSMDLGFDDTVNYSVVEETIDVRLKSHSRYDTYINGSKEVNGNRFSTLLDELTAYLGAAVFECKYIKSDRIEILPRNQSRVLDSNPAGTVNFMVYLQCYLKSTRLNHKQIYSKIKLQRSTIAYIKKLWSTAEQMLIDVYPYTHKNETGTTIQIPFDYLRVAYSDDMLLELDLLEIPHMISENWEETYLKR